MTNQPNTPEDKTIESDPRYKELLRFEYSACDKKDGSLADKYFTASLFAKIKFFEEKLVENDKAIEFYEEMESRFCNFLCHATGDRMSKSNYDLLTMIAECDDFQQEHFEKYHKQEISSLKEQLEEAKKENAASVFLLMTCDDEAYEGLTRAEIKEQIKSVIGMFKQQKQ